MDEYNAAVDASQLATAYSINGDDSASSEAAADNKRLDQDVMANSHNAHLIAFAKSDLDRARSDPTYQPGERIAGAGCQKAISADNRSKTGYPYTQAHTAQVLSDCSTEYADLIKDAAEDSGDNHYMDERAAANTVTGVAVAYYTKGDNADGDAAIAKQKRLLQDIIAGSDNPKLVAEARADLRDIERQ